MITVQNLHLFADNGELLIITTKQTSPLHHEITIKDRGAFTITSNTPTQSLLNTLRSELQHYPQHVSIDGEPMARTPFPDLAQMTLTSYRDHSQDHPETRVVQLEDGYRYYHHQNLFVAGVLFTMNRLPNPTTYYTPGPSAFTHWQPAFKVTVTPISNVTTEEFHKLTSTELTLLIERNRILPLVQELSNREEDQVRRTIRHPNAPMRYTGEIYHYAAGHYYEASEQFKRGEPIIVHRKPVAIAPNGLSNAEYISIAEALYTNEQEFVPVGAQDQPFEVLTEIEVQRQPSNPNNNAYLQAVDSIRVSTGINKKAPRNTVAASMWLTNDEEDSREIGYIFHVPGKLDRHYLAECLMRAYWNDDPEDDIDHTGFAANMAGLARAATGEPVEAYRDQLQQLVDNFNTKAPKPRQPTTVTSADGTITITYRPRNSE